MFVAKDHTFVVCAYKESLFLEECLESLFRQDFFTQVIMATSTPNEYIKTIAAKYDVPLFVNSAESGIASDWNFGVQCANTPLVTIAHQDDIYESGYSQRIFTEINKTDDFLIAFTDYGEVKNGVFLKTNNMLQTKRLLLSPLKNARLANKTIVKRRILSLGNPICCPAVTYNLKKLPHPLFESDFRSNLDWEAWEKFSRIDGAFVYIPTIGMYHRVHEGSETSACIADNIRTEEDYQMLKKFWPSPIARMINWQYKKSQVSNNY